MIELHSEIDNWKDKHNRTQDEVAKLKVKYSLDKFRPIWTSLDTQYTLFSCTTQLRSIFRHNFRDLLIAIFMVLTILISIFIIDFKRYCDIVLCLASWSVAKVVDLALINYSISIAQEVPNGKYGSKLMIPIVIRIIKIITVRKGDALK